MSKSVEVKVPTGSETAAILRHPVVVAVLIAGILWLGNTIWNLKSDEAERIAVEQRLVIQEQNSIAQLKYYDDISKAMQKSSTTAKAEQIRKITKELNTLDPTSDRAIQLEQQLDQALMEQ